MANLPCLETSNSFTVDGQTLFRRHEKEGMANIIPPITKQTPNTLMALNTQMVGGREPFRDGRDYQQCCIQDFLGGGALFCRVDREGQSYP